MTTKMQQRRGTAAQWTSANTVLAAGEMGVETDTHRVKCGDGSTAWNSLSYLTLADGEVTSAKILDGTIVNADISSSAAISSAKLVFGTATHTAGTGSPEGVVTATPGSTFLQTNSTVDARGFIVWRKWTGTGNTGWQVFDGNTGLVTLPATLPLTSGELKVRRIGHLVSCTIQGASSGALTSSTVADAIPSGFRPAFYTIGEMNRSANDELIHVYFNTNGSITFNKAATGGSLTNGQWTWMTDNAWPSTL